MIPLVCLDVDGTLVGSEGQVSDAVWSAASAARDRGQHLALCTARGAFGSSWEMAQRLDPTGHHVFHAGGAVVSALDASATGSTIDHELVVDLIDLGVSRDWVTELYSATDYVVDSTAGLAADHADLMGTAHQPRPVRDFVDSNDIVRVQFVVQESEITAVIESVARTGLTATSATSPIMPGAAFVSVTAANVTKATGISAIAALLDLPMSAVMMVGDGHNDVPAMHAVGVPVAMANAEPEVHRLASHIVGHVDADGAAEALALSAELDPVD